MTGRCPPKAEVAGSNPVGSANKIKTLAGFLQPLDEALSAECPRNWHPVRSASIRRLFLSLRLSRPAIQASGTGAAVIRRRRDSRDRNVNQGLDEHGTATADVETPHTA